MVINCRINALILLVFFILPLPGEDKGMEIPYPDQYFAVDQTDYKDEEEKIWHILFPAKPEFKYAFLYLPSFEKNLGFYIENDNLHWAISTHGLGYLDDLNILNLKEIGTSHLFINALQIVFPYLSRSVIMANPDIYSSFLSAANSMFCNAICSCLYTERGQLKLDEKTAAELRKTWDLAVAERTLNMPVFRQYLATLDGNYSYYRGGYGAIGEDIWLGNSKIRRGMSELSFALIHMADKHSLSEDNLVFIRDKCQSVQKDALGMDDTLPSMVSTEWVNNFANSYHEYMDRQRGKPSVSDTLLSQDSTPNDSDNSSEIKGSKAETIKEETRKIKEILRGFLTPPENNEVWKGLLPSHTSGVPGFLVLTRDNGAWALSLKDGIVITASYEPRYANSNQESTQKETKLKSTNYFATGLHGDSVELLVSRDYDRLSYNERKRLGAILDKIPNQLSSHSDVVVNTDDFSDFDDYYILLISVNAEGKTGYLVSNEESRSKYIYYLRSLVACYHNHAIEERERLDILQFVEEELSQLSDLIK